MNTIQLILTAGGLLVGLILILTGLSALDTFTWRPRYGRRPLI
jgi:hypothetical protein